MKKLWREWDDSITAHTLANLPEDLESEEKQRIYADQDRPIHLEYIDVYGITTHFLTCPTIGDGDCLVHAAFTQKGENANLVVRKAATMRKNLINAITNDTVANYFKLFVCGQYMYLLSEDENHKEVPGNIKNMFIQQGFIEADIISPNDVREYIKRLEDVKNGPEAYIPLERGVEICPAHWFAWQGRKQFRIFEFNEKTGKLDWIKDCGNPNDLIINILYKDNHYTRFFAYDDEKNECNQIFQNYLDFKYRGR